MSYCQTYYHPCMKLPKRLSFPILIYFIGLSLVGLCLIPHLSIKLAPDRTLPRLSISYSMPGQSPRVIESQVTSQIEAMVSRISGITDITSNSGNGSGQIVLSINKDADIDAVRFEISNAIRQLWPQLPKGASYPVVSAWRSDSRANAPLLTYTLNAPGSPNRILQYAEKNIRPRLTRIEGISSITISGAQPMEWRLEYDKNKLEETGIEPAEIQKAVSSQLASSFVGMTTRAEQAYCAIYVKPETDGQEALEKIVIKKADGKLIRLNEVVRITHKEQDARNHHRINGLNTIYMTIHADENANQIKLSEQIRKQIAEMGPTFPNGYELHLTSDTSETIKDEITDIIIRSSTALLILLLFVFLINRSFRYQTVIILSVGANIAISFIFYYWLDIEIQLYSIAGITISLGLIIDNILVMTDHILHRGRMNIFMAILASTLTTIASLSVIFFLDEKAQLNLLDFSRVLIINLSVSLAIALLLVPALLNNAHLAVKSRHLAIRQKRHIVTLNRRHATAIRLLCTHKKLCYTLLILSFGLPVFLIPSSLKGKSAWVQAYNTVVGSGVCHFIRSYTDPLLGGSLRLFVQRTSGRAQLERTAQSLSIRAYMPYGSTLEEMNSTIKQVENHIRQFNGVQQFQTHIYSPQNAHISVTFTKDGEAQDVPRKMQDALISQVVHIGNATWSISGVGHGFSNDVSQRGGLSNLIRLSGYNYDELMHHALALSKRLDSHPRIQRIAIVPKPGYSATDYEEYIFETSPERLALNNLNISSMNSAVQSMLPQTANSGFLISRENGMEPINIQPLSLRSADIWDVKHNLYARNGNAFRIEDAANVIRRQIPKDIEKANQQYQLYVNYDFVGGAELNHSVQKEVIREYSGYLPMGYEIDDMRNFNYEEQQKASDFWIILLIILIIYIICCILYDSFVLPFVVIIVIPISFIGIFLSFTAFSIPLNQGGFAAFILLSGLTCNSVIYLLNDYVSLRRKGHPADIRTYLKAFNGKIIPVFLTILSTALGFIPFMFDAQIDSFWMSLSVGTICGLFFSIIGIIIYLPVTLGVGKKK